MGKYLILTALATFIVGCLGSPKSDSRVKLATNSSAKHAQSNALLTDSATLAIHLDSLTIPNFPLNTTKLTVAIQIDLSAFKSKKLRGLPLNAHERIIGGAIIDGDTSYKFDLVDSTFKAKWILLAKKQKYFAVLIDETIATLTYDLKVIDAMHVMANDGNNHYHGILSTTINNDLKLTLNYYYEVQVDDKGTYNHQIENDLWYSDQHGYFKFRRTLIVQEIKL